MLVLCQEHWVASTHFPCTFGHQTLTPNLVNVKKTAIITLFWIWWVQYTRRSKAHRSGKLEGPVDGSAKGLEEGTLLKCGLLQGDAADGELEGPVESSDQGLEKAHCSNWACSKATNRDMPKH